MEIKALEGLRIFIINPQFFAIHPLSGKVVPGTSQTPVAKAPAPHKIENICASTAAFNWSELL